MIQCSEFEVLLADSMDGALAAPGREADRLAFAEHLKTCQACAEMARDVQSALSLMEVAAEPEVPRELTAKILQATNSGWELKLRGPGIRGWINRLLAPILQPRFVMGAMLTLMSLTMLTRCAGSKATMTAADLDPVRLWTSIETRTEHTWNQVVKSYESLRVVYEIRNQISDWNKQQAAEDEAAADARANSHRLNLPAAGQPAGAQGASGREAAPPAAKQ